MSKTCPLCRSPRAFADTMRLHGLDELIEGISEALIDQADESAN